jgi:hypothetical protein
MRRLLLASLVALGACASGPRTSYVPRDASLARAPLFFYPSQVDSLHPRAFILFLGNDVAFWEPHQELAWRLSKQGYAVAGLDIKKYLAALPEPEPARDSAFAAGIAPFIARVRHEMRADSLPMIIGGHSFGAEVAFWVALHQPPPHLVGVLALSSRSTGHLFVTPLDLLNYEASGRWAFSTIQAAHDIAPGVRIALVRGAHDPFIAHDSAFVAAGGPRLKHYVIPLAGHSLKKLVIAGPMIERAVDWLLTGQ